MSRNYLYALSIVASLFTMQLCAQNVSINEDGSLPNPNAILDIKSSTKGVLIPRVSTTGRLAIPNTKGLLVYDTTAGSFWFNTGSGWQNMTAPGTTTGWSLTGNSGTNENNFLGTIDDRPLILKLKNHPAGRMETDLTNNVFWGYQSGAVNSGNQNTAIGNFTMMVNTGGHNNTASGFASQSSNTIGLNNTSAGAFSLYLNTTGYQNTATGTFAMRSNTIGTDNTATGVQSLFSNISGSFNTAHGEWAMYSNTSGNNNTAAGYLSLFTNQAGSNNTAIGASADMNNNVSNSTAIGANAFVSVSDKVRIGNGAVTSIEGQVPFTTPSDGRFKYGVKEDVKGLDFILQLRPVTYQFDVKRFDTQERKLQKTNSEAAANNFMNAAYDKAAAIRRSGFIAQEVEKAAAASGYDFSGIIKPQSEQDHYSLSYESFVVPLVKAVQEQQKLIVDMQQQIGELRKALKASK